MGDLIHVERIGQVAVVRFNRAETLNSMKRAMAEQYSAALCALAVEATSASTFSRLGPVAEYDLPLPLPSLIGVGRTLDVLLSRSAVTTNQAKEQGLVEYVVPLADLLDPANCSPTSLAMIKAQVYADLDRDVEPARADTLERMDDSFRHSDLDEALLARAGKRSPNFEPYPRR